MTAPTYVELEVSTNFSFLRGASHPDELVRTAAALGHKAIAITDRNSLAGVVRAHAAAKQSGIRILVGVRLDFRDGTPSLLCYPTDRAAYGRLCRLLTNGNLKAPKAECHLDRSDLIAFGEGQMLVCLPPDRSDPDFPAKLMALADAFPGRLHLAARHLMEGDDETRIAALAALADAAGTPLVATNDVHYHTAERRPLQDALVCIREHCTIEQAGDRLFANAERRLKSAEEMAGLFARWPDALARTVRIAEACRFSLDTLRYEYPDETVPEGSTPQDHLESLTWNGAKERYPEGIPEKVSALLRHEFHLIGKLRYAPYFLTVHDIVRHARVKDILCQGRGSAANSAVCYCLGITSVDPDKSELLFERFLSEERNEPPDIDVDFEHARREEVIQYIYAKYGRQRAGIAATVITYRSRSAIREIGKALGLSTDVVSALAGSVWGISSHPIEQEHVTGSGLDPADARLSLALKLAEEIRGFPRHLSQHVGGFVMTRGPLSEMVPIANAAMDERTFIEWDKNDIDALGILKVDILALGMLTAIQKSFHLIRQEYGRDYDLATVPQEEKAVYDMLCKADSIGVFQVESRAQMSMLPRLKPQTFYDLVIQVAIVRPGPIQGDMVHPYLRRRTGKEKVDYPSPALQKVLERTLGVPLFQEHAMRIAIVGAGFTPAESDLLRRAMATFRNVGTIHTFREKFVNGMLGNGYPQDFAERCFKQIEGFGSYGFPESHAAAFAQLAYVSAWLKCRYPAAFTCALLNSQPMGFYAPAQLVRDVRNHGVEVRPVDINISDWDCTLEPAARGRALRLGFRQILGLKEGEARKLVEKRGAGYRDARDLWRRAGLARDTLEALAEADAFNSVGLDRRAALWAVKGLRESPLPLFDGPGTEPNAILPMVTPGEHVVEDYTALRLTLRQHPLALLREDLRALGAVTADRLAEAKNGARIAVAGLTIVRQRPGSAKGVVFLTIEDETAPANVVVWPHVFETCRPAVLGARLVLVRGKVQSEEKVIHLVAETLTDITPLLAKLTPEGRVIRQRSRNFQ
jgi:error-prone DNA polymerase